jgi:hypothetical protein
MVPEADATAADLDATIPEVKELVSFLDGSIQVPEVRHHLWRSWGFCERHTWVQAVVEVELRGGRPFGTAILYEDLVRRAHHALDCSLVPPSVRVRWLRPRALCFTCDYLAIVKGADPGYRERTNRVNRRERTASMLEATRDEWERRSCPACLDGQGPVCRPHLLAGEPADLGEVAGLLDELSGRLEVFHRSMTWHGPTADPAQRASWVEALGWFAGWRYPAAVVRTQARGPRCSSSS